jgi:hypothetical protein
MRLIWDKARSKWVPPVNKKTPSGPYIIGDLPAYKSPTGSGVIDGRTARREDLARSGCREVDPSEKIDSTPKPIWQADEERAYLKARESGPQIDPRAVAQLMRGQPRR